LKFVALIAVVIVLLALVVAGMSTSPTADGAVSLFNVSYDPTREFYQEISTAFAQQWKAERNQTVIINQSHSGSGKQARAVIDGLPADIVTLALAYDIDAIAQKSAMLPADWQKRLPQNSSPYTSTVVFLVRKGNPKGIRDWDDLVRLGVEVIPANPKSSGGARWAYLAAYGFALRKNADDHSKAKAFIGELYKHAPVLDSSARAATSTFLNGTGDVLIGWESEALLVLNDLGKDRFEIVTPSLSILAEPPIALIDKNVDRHGTREVTQAFAEFLYTSAGQEIAAGHYFRPRDQAVLERHRDRFPEIALFTIDEMFGGWKAAHAAHFADGGVFDEVYRR
jgi:sulfate transport system substrate-binding protein